MNGDLEFYIFFSILFLIILGFIIAETIRKKSFDKAMQKNISDIIPNNEFETLYNKIINNQDFKAVISEQKRYRLESILGSTLQIIGFLGFLSIVPIVSFFDFLDDYWIISYVLCLGVIILSAVIRRTKPLRYKTEIIKEIVTAINPSIKYKHMDSNDIFSSLCGEIYWNANFNDLMSNQGYVTDYMEYNISSGDYAKLVDLRLQYYYYSQHRKCSSTTDVFEGIVAKITRDKFINNEILIEQNKIFKNKNYIRYDDKEFEKYFDVFASNVENCSLVITPTVKNELLTLAKKYGILFEISLKGNDLFIRFFTKKLFEAKPQLMSPINKKKLYKDYVTFKLITMIIEYINSIL